VRLELCQDCHGLHFLPSGACGCCRPVLGRDQHDDVAD
jgi:hypothetical protein